MRIPDDVVEKIREASDIVSVARHLGLPIKKKGFSYTCLSPFKAERTPSFYLHPQKNIFKCFATGIGGSPTKLVMELERLDYPQALRRMAEWAGIEVPDRQHTPEEQRRLQHQQRLSSLCQFVHLYCASKLPGTAAALHLLGRGLGPIELEAFGYGACPPDLPDVCARQGFSESEMVAVGVLSASQIGQGARFPHSGKLLVPLHDQAGKAVGMAWRLLEGDGPKYVNSPDSPIFNKSLLLYNLARARRHVAADDTLVLCEGYFHVAAWARAGHHNAVASCGTSLTDGQVKAMARICSRVLVAYDTDEAGLRATLRAIDMLLDAGLDVAVLPVGDADDAIRVGGPELLQQAYRDAAFVPGLAAMLGLQQAHGSARVQALRAIRDACARIRDAAVRQVAIEEAVALGVSGDLFESVEKRAAEPHEQPVPTETTHHAASRRAAAERLLAGITIQDPDIQVEGLRAREFIAQQIGELPLEDPVVSVAASALWRGHAGDTEDVQEALAQLILPPGRPPVQPVTVSDAVDFVQHQHLLALLAQSRKEVDLEKDPAVRSQLLARHKRLRAIEQQHLDRMVK